MVGIVSLALICLFTPSSSQKYNNMILKEYDRKVCKNEFTCAWLNKYPLKEDRRTLKKRNCMCDEECKLYKDCCLDSLYYDDVEQNDSSEFYCPPSIKVYTKIACASSWPDDYVNDYCKKSVQTLDSNNTLVHVPVTSSVTGITYANRYCAICNDEPYFDNWEMNPACAESSGPSSTTPQNQFKTDDKPNSEGSAEQNNIPDLARVMVHEPVPIIINREANQNSLFQPLEQFRNPQISYIDAPFQIVKAMPKEGYQMNNPNHYFGKRGEQNRFNRPFNWHKPSSPPPVLSRTSTKSGLEAFLEDYESWTPETSYVSSSKENQAFDHDGTQEKSNNDHFSKPSEIVPKIILNIFGYGNRNPVVNEDQGAEINVYFYGDSARHKRQATEGLDFNKYAKESGEIWKSVWFDPTTKQLRSEYMGKNFVCDFSVKAPKELVTRFCIPNVIVKCKDESDPDLAKACRSHTMIVWNKNTKQPYRNEACALCNGETKSDLTPCLAGDRDGLGNSVEVGSQGIGENEDPCKSPNATSKIMCRK